MEHQKANKRIAIVGGGIGGVTCAGALRKFGIMADVFEQAPEIKEIGAVLGVLPNGMQVLNFFGKVNELVAKGGPLKTFIVGNHKGKTFRKTFFNYSQPALVVRRSDLLNTLLNTVDSAHLFTDHKLRQLELLPSGTYVLHFANKPSREYDLVIGADGIRSVVRKFVVGEDEPIYRGYNLWRGVAEFSHGLDASAEIWGPGLRVGYYPMGNTHVGWWAAIEEAQDAFDGPAGAKEKLMERFKSWPDPIPKLFAESPNIIKNNIFDRVPSKPWMKGNVGIIGDAAHCTTPNLGQGANMAMESALVLARCIHHYGPGEVAFRKYQEVQFKRTRGINRVSLILGIVGKFHNPIALAIRNAILMYTPTAIITKTYDAHYSYNPATVSIH